MKSKKNKSDEPSLRDKLSQKFLEAFESDFAANGVSVIEQLRLKSPDKYAEIGAKLIAAAQSQPQQGGYADCQSTQEVARKLLIDCGASEFAITDDMVDEAIKESDRHVEELGRIASRAVQ